MYEFGSNVSGQGNRGQLRWDANSVTMSSMNEIDRQKQERSLSREPIAERRSPVDLGDEEQEMGAVMSALPPLLPEEHLPPVSFAVWGLVFVGGAVMWATLFFVLS
jgi:hypothetical protein